MGIPKRLERQTGRYALVDGIPYHLPVNSVGTQAFMAAFPIDPGGARELLPGNELHPIRVGSKSLLVITVVNYRKTDIGKYIEFSIAVACSHGERPAPPVLPLVFQKLFGMGQYVVDLPVSTEISVKGGKGIWGMPKHQANLDFTVGRRRVGSQYDKDGQLAMRVEIARPRIFGIPVSVRAANYCQFRGMLMKSYIYFRGTMWVALGPWAAARISLGDHPRVQALKHLGIGRSPVFTAFLPAAAGVLDDYYESWFVTHDRPPEERPEGLESVIDLGLSEEWLVPPSAPS